MVDVVKIGVISTQHLEQVEWKTVPAVIIDRLHRHERVQEDGILEGQVGDCLGHYSPETVKHKTLHGVTVRCAKRVGYI